LGRDFLSGQFPECFLTMIRSLALLVSLLLSGCATQTELAPEQLAKIDPKLRILLEREDVSSTQYDISVRSDGSREYGVIVYGSNPDTLRRLGIPLQTVLGEMMTARVTVAQLRLLASQSTVRSIASGGKAYPH
jgi:outer membrane biogenesis lipoprotein LolB